MKIVFFGSDNLAQAFLETLISSAHEVAAVVTQPDKPKGRGYKVAQSPVKERALETGIKVLTLLDLKSADFLEELKALKADLFIVISYGRFLPAEVLSMPRFGAVNLHPSLLPQYRGAAPMNWAILNGEAETGISIIKLNAQMDAGDILSQQSFSLDEEETAETLKVKVILNGRQQLLQCIDDIGKGKVTLLAQDNDKASYAPKLTKELGLIDWSKSNQEIYRLIRALIPWPRAYTFYKNKILKVLHAQCVDCDTASKQAGEILDISPDGILVAAGEGAFLIRQVHFQDAKPTDAYSFTRGHALKPGDIF